MKLYACLISDQEAKSGMLGWNYVSKHKSDWIDMTAANPYLTSGYVKGVDYCVYNGTVYWLLKTYIDLETKDVIRLCKESTQGCDLPDLVEENPSSDEPVDDDI